MMEPKNDSDTNNSRNPQNNPEELEKKTERAEDLWKVRDHPDHITTEIP